MRLSGIAAALLVLAASAAAPVATAAGVRLNAVQFPERRTIDLTFLPTDRAPSGSSLAASVRAEGARTRVDVSWLRMQPALLFGGDVTSYVLWSVTKDGVAENLGELYVDEPGGDARFQTGKKQFGLMVTAEPFPGSTRPGEVVVFTSDAAPPAEAPTARFDFSGFAPGVRPEHASIGVREYRGGEPLALVQARTVLAMAEKVGAAGVNPKAMEEARRVYAQASNSTMRGGSARAVLDYSRRTVSLASEAIRDLYRKREADEAAKVEAERLAHEEGLRRAALTEADRRKQTEEAMAELSRLRQKTQLDLEQTRQAAAALDAAKSSLEGEKAALVAQTATLEAEKGALLAEKARLEEEKAALQRERDALAARLGGALEKVAETRKSARGLVVNLPGISFDTNRATLKPGTRVTLGKLSGILLMLPDLNIRVEGYTDSTGKAATNRKLSAERARNVFGFLRELGIAETRMAWEGYGPENPVAANDTAQGRAKNRRVEIVVAEGKIEGAPRSEARPEPAPAAAPIAPKPTPK